MAIQTDRTQLRVGQLVRWDAGKGFGFIRPADGGTDVFVHISALPQARIPAIGTRIVYSAVDDPRGRGQRALKAICDRAGASDQACATTQPPPSRTRGPARPRPLELAEQGRRSRPRAALAAPKRRNETLRALPFNGLTVAVAAITLFCLWGALTALPVTPIPLLAYPIASLAAFLLYARDKYSAIHGAWRVPESSLHGLEALGGWPGAYVAQQTMRHKTAKESYQIAFWLIVAVHAGVWGLWIFDPELIRMWVLAAIGR